MGPRKLKNEKLELQKENGTDVREAIIKKNIFFLSWEKICIVSWKDLISSRQDEWENALTYANSGKNLKLTRICAEKNK